MGIIEFEIERTITAPIQDVFARLADIDGHNQWMPKKGSILVRHHAKMHTYGISRLATPIYRRVARRERTATIDALKASFESGG